MKHTAYASIIINAPIEKVWKLVRDFNGLPSWHLGISKSVLEDDKLGDQIGAVRHLDLNPDFVREKLLMLDDDTFSMKYSIIETSMGMCNYTAGINLYYVTESKQTFAEWWGDFDVKPNFDRKVTIENVESGVFAGGLKFLKKASE